MLPEPDNFGVLYHKSYRVHPDGFRKCTEWKKMKKKVPKSRSKQKKLELLYEGEFQTAPEIELPLNSSGFALFASIRLAVLDRWMKSASQEYLQSSCSIPVGDHSDFESDTEDNTQSSTYVPTKVSKVVGLGIRSVFELIKESRVTHPVLCTRALLALLDVLQGQSPEGLKSEPPDVTDSLFELLLDLATLHGPESSVPNDGTHLTAVACACLLALVVVRGDTGKYLSATAALLMCPRALSIQNIQMPAVLSSLQRSVHGILLGKMLRPDWLTHGVPKTSQIDSFQVKMPNDLINTHLGVKALAFDSQYLYLFSSRGLLKIGSGYGSTIKGHVSFWKPDFYPNDNGSLVYCLGNLYLKLCGRRGGEFLIVERNSLLISGSVPLQSRDVGSSVIFSDGENLGTISTAKDDGFVVRLLNQNTVPASQLSELPLKLARKCVDVLGYAPFEDECGSYTINLNTEEEVSTICIGKEFGLLRSVTGKVMYTGKPSALGIKQAGVRSGKWSELVLTKSPKIIHVAIGHDGLHAILVAEDGSVFFTGTARRGEDGDQSKVRRQPKAVKPKKMMKVDGQHIVTGACNNGTTALVTRDGELLIFGKDTTHCDAATGVVTSLKGEFVTQVALGKAHAIALTSKGHIYSFGINNKFQCGREFAKQQKEGIVTHVIAMETCQGQEEHEYYDEVEEMHKESGNVCTNSEGNLEDAQQNICAPGMHNWHDDLCMICTVCRECTGYSISCLSSMSAERNPGQECGCGEGDSGCAVCGCCRICAHEVVDNSELADLAGVMRIEQIFRDNKVMLPPRQRTKLQEQIQSRLDDRKNKSVKSIASSSKQPTKLKSSRSSVIATPTHKSNVARQSNLLGAVKEQTSSDVERDTARVACLPPAKLPLPSDSPVVQIACGLHHSVLLLQNGQVLTFGSNLYGQLGCGDILAKNAIQQVKLPNSAVHVAAGSNHTVVLTSKGEVYTFGNAEKGQLGRQPPPQEASLVGQSSTSSRYSNPRTPWYSTPGPMPSVGPKHGRRATWVGASGDQSFVKLDESLINSVSISKSTITANKHSIILVPNQEAVSKNFKCLVINRKDGNCNSFKGPDQADFSNKVVCMDPIYNVLWSYNPSNHEIDCYNVIASELQTTAAVRTTDKKILTNIKTVNEETVMERQSSLNIVLSPELALPVMTNCHVSRFQAAINLLCCLDTLTMAHDLQISAVKEEVDERQLISGKQYLKEDFMAVNRFESHGGGWGYSGHSIEAIRFTADTDLLLGGFGLFGGRGEYTAKLKLLDIGPNGGEQEIDGQLLAETEEVPYECGPRQKCSVLFDEPVQLQDYNPHSPSNSQMLLSAVLCALCAPNVRLRSTFPLLGTSMNAESSLHRGLSPSDNTGHPMMSVSDSHHYPILVEQMSYKTQMESNYAGLTWQWNDILERLMNLVSDPILQVLRKQVTISLPELSKYCCHLLARVLGELVHQCSSSDEDMQAVGGRILHMTPSRFTRTNQSRTWNTGNGSPDAICFQVDRPGISIVGVGIYGGIGHYEYELELLEDTSLSTGLENHTAHRWNSLEIAAGSFGPEDFAPDIVEVKFDRVVSVKENVKYAIRLRIHGGRTNNGDGGLSSVKGSDNTTFTFSTCSLSFNGTTLTRGQIPILLYYSNPSECGKTTASKLEFQARKAALSMTSSIVQKASKLMMLARERADEVSSVSILSESRIVKTLLPLVLAHISPLASSDPKSAVHILSLIQELLPHVAALNLMDTPTSSRALVNSNTSNLDSNDNKIVTTSNHCTWVESEHPYKPANVANYRVSFPDTVKWMSLEFDQACATAQPEDSLQLYIPALDFNPSKENASNINENFDCPSLPYWPVLHKFSGSLQWPTNAVVLPGNEVVFSLETATDYLKDDRASAYGFKCLVIGYEWPPDSTCDTGLRHLEAELAFLGGMCSASLMKKDLLLPVVGEEGEIDVETAEVVAGQIFSDHNSLLSKGLALSSPPTVSQALDGMLPYSVHSNERLFLRDFVNCVAGSSGARLAQWLQPGSRVDPSKCQVLYNRDELRCGWPAIITILTRDQYSDLVHVPNMKVDVKALPIDKKELGDSEARKMRRVSQPDPLTFGGLPPPPLHHAYESTVRDKMCFHAITVMKPYQNYSFEELRYTSPPVKRSSENMLVRPNCDGTYSATWTPASVGCYSMVVTIDGYDMEEAFKVEVKEPPQGMVPPNQNLSKKASNQPNRVRKFVAKNSAGLRIRAHPSLQSEQIGVVHVNGTIVFIDEIHNDDGVWLRLSADTIRQYCGAHIIEAWCLQYNQHLGKTLLLPVEEPKSILDQVITDTITKRIPEIQDKSKHSQINYKVIKCGASGHNVRSRPSLKAPPVGMLVLGNRVGVSEYVANSEGCWVLLDKATREKYCFSTDSEAWSLAIGDNILYLDTVNDSDEPQISESRKVFNFSCPKSGDFNFSAQESSATVKGGATESLSTNPFVFGETNESSKFLKRDRREKIKTKPKMSRSEEVKNDVMSDAIRPVAEHGANGNGTPPDTPKRSLSPRPGQFSPKPASRSSSPVAVSNRTFQADSGSNSPQIYGSSRSIGLSPLVSGTGYDSTRRGSNQSDTSALVSSITRDLSQSPSQATQSRETSPSPSGSSFHTRSEPSPPLTPAPTRKECVDNEQNTKKLTQTGTQTSPENVTNSLKGHFSIGSVSKEEKVSPKLSRKERGSAKARPKRAISPANMHQPSSGSKINYPGSEPVKQATSPSVAESLRAGFAAFLWHEGIVHDAMACASFLKFHPTLPKQGALVVTRPDLTVEKRQKELTKEEKARQRHSVEVSNAGYLHIQPSTLESLTRSAANASANRNRSRKITDGIIKEEDSNRSYNYQTISVLPPALKSLVHLWEELTTTCLQTISEQTASPSQNKGKKGGDAYKMDAKEKNNTVEKESKKSKKKKVPPRNYLEDIGISSYLHSSGVETLCELCSETFPHPVTYHMHHEHPGCGQHAGGKGYNSGGNYCLGWAGNCGDGGVPGSSWYLLCEPCRDKYMKTSRGNKPLPKSKTVSLRKPLTMKPSSMTSGSEPHIVMKNNAVFLMDLASTTDSNMTHQRRASGCALPSLSENITPPDCSGPFGPLPPFQCLTTLGASFTEEATFYNEILQKQNALNGYLGAPSTSNQRPLSEISLSENESDGARGVRFHRSVSMGTNGVPWAKAGFDGRIIMMRRRNNSSCVVVNEGGSSLLCNPSSALQKLIPKEELSSVVKPESSSEHRGSLNLLQRPVLQFITQQHDLDSLKFCMKQALRKAMCRVYAMQALNWLLRSVTQPICLHDLLWWFVTSLTPIEVEFEAEEDNRPPKKADDQELNVCDHPLSDISIAGDAVHPLPGTFHALLQTIANLMILLPMGSPLQQIAVRCWGLRFAPSDHSFLHRSQVFNNISKILSRSEEMEDFTVSMHESAFSQISSSVECLKDLTMSVDMKASSRQAMIGSLTDGSTETFWESGDEDRNKTKSITLICPQGHHPMMVCVHVDNCRDLGNKVSTISFYAGQNTDELAKLRTIEVETKLLGGWINCPVTETGDSIIRLELKGPDNSVRVRQLRVLGRVEGEPLKVGKLYSAATIQQRNCEAETLRVFRLITSQVFGKLIQGETQNGENLVTSTSDNGEPVEESNDLREHMVGILFSRSKLTHLQKQVIVHIVQAIRKETDRVHEEWEANTYAGSATSTHSSSDATKNSDTYCFEMLSMVLALSGSSVGRAYLSHQGGLLGDLLVLLHTGSARVQRQVISLIKRMLPEISPEFFAKVVGVKNLPPKDFNIFPMASKDSNSGKFDIQRLGLLDVFLSVIAKALTVQVKLRGKNGGGGPAKEINTVTLATSANFKDDTRWWLKGCTNRKLAEVIVQLITDMSAGKLSEVWANITKGAIAENIINLTCLTEEQRNPNICMKTPTLWLALASLCVLDKDHVERLSSGQWNKSEGQNVPPRPMCTNHDDGETFAVIQCNVCGNLCADCDRFLHLHRKTRGHLRQVCKEEEEAIKVELHEGCGRTKLFWLLALADSRTLKALVEFREGSTRTKAAGITGVCRFCGTTGNSGLLAIGNVCADSECQEYGKSACAKLLNCGHMCGGVFGESKCLPCLHGCSNDATLRQDSDDMCMICFTEALSCAPALQLRCGHVFHLHCCKAVLMKRWAGPRITFSFSLCPICKIEIKHPMLEELLMPIHELYRDVRRKALMRLEYEGLNTVDAVGTPGTRFYNDPAAFAMDRYAYYVCYKCNKAYYGGEARCDAEVGDNYDPTELVCGACSDVARAQMCPKHGTDFLEYKCRYCCSVAVFFCFGTTHFCNPCHDDFQRVTNLPKSELPLCPAGPRASQLDGDECPLHVKHPPTGEEFALGCGVCRNAHTF
ncbi:E3 ubiquitin-protein ligase MYCBP2 isoform X2 [Cylas formicarius]|uniref:E3 ubiquitin-protein ligase MYCBP2 isoform X2 n=1 Tax=Cylas formicarius TaxID=197179 RepID=UPI002958CE93|nr:E3 ubiquitin-protein ligase MYCBP2 isoform X2 [Cylas formicarius]